MPSTGARRTRPTTENTPCTTRACAPPCRRRARPAAALERGPGRVDGFDVVAAIGADSMPATIFVTAYDQYAVRAFEIHALDYLLDLVRPGSAPGSGRLRARIALLHRQRAPHPRAAAAGRRRFRRRACRRQRSARQPPLSRPDRGAVPLLLPVSHPDR